MLNIIMDYCRHLLFLSCLSLLGTLSITYTSTSTASMVAAMSIGNQDLERYFRTVNNNSALASEERIAMDFYTYAFLNYSYTEDSTLHPVQYNAEKARYGEGKILTVHGELIHISDVNNSRNDTACSPNIAGTNGNAIPATGSWIALVRRGHCTFEEKVKNVFLKGAAGVIIYNDRPVVSLEKMQIKGKQRNITAVITYQEIGLEMASRLDAGSIVTAHIIEGRSGMRPINNLNRTSVLFVAISFIILMVISLVWLIFYYIQKFRYMQSKDQQSRHLCSVTKKAIMKIPTKTGKSTDEKDADSDCCAICIESYKSADLIRVLPCNHEFHKNCIDPWLIEHRTCPMCKLDVLKFYGYVFLGSEESIVEYDPEPQSAFNNNAATASDNNLPANINLQPRGALADLIRSRDFVIDFPRIFVLDGGRDTLFPNGMPERSQSSTGIANAKDWMSTVANKLEEQHGMRRARKPNPRMEMQENLLSVRQESLKHRRSHSAEGGYCVNNSQRCILDLENPPDEAYGGPSISAYTSQSSVAMTSRRSSLASYQTVTMQPNVELKSEILNKRRISLLARMTNSDQRYAMQHTSRSAEEGAAGYIARNSSSDSNGKESPKLRIQLNGKGLDLE